MKLPMYAVRDVKHVFWAPQVENNEDTAIRGFALMINTNSLTQFTPSDFDFYKVGTFDTVKGTVEALEQAEFVCSGQSVYGANYEK